MKHFCLIRCFFRVYYSIAIYRIRDNRLCFLIVFSITKNFDSKRGWESYKIATKVRNEMIHFKKSLLSYESKDFYVLSV